MSISEIRWDDWREPMGWTVGVIIFLGHAGLAFWQEYWITGLCFILVTLSIGYIAGKKIYRVRQQHQLERITFS